MADGVATRTRLSVHQALHGYSDGHREIATSVRLTSRDMRTVLGMSDLASAGSSVSESGYLTGYPLIESEHYAIARTWLAPEMTRPGCVWTHTLFIRFADLSSLTNSRDIMASFRRPTPAMFADYGNQLTVEATEPEPFLLSSYAVNWTTLILSALYEYPKDKIVATAPTEFDPDSIILAIWLQQWAEARRNFCFCTATNSDRTTDRFWFDLQLLPNLDRGLRSRFPDAKFVSDISSAPDSWVYHTMQDLLEPDKSSLRSFFRSAGANIPNGRAALASLTQLHKMLIDIPARPEAAEEAIKLLDSSPLAASAAALGMVLDCVAPLAATLSANTLSYLVHNVDRLSEGAVRKYGKSLAYAVWRRKPEDFTELLAAGGAVGLESTNALDSLSIEDLLEGIKAEPELIGIVLGRHPELAADPALWEAKGPLRDAAFQHLRDAPELWPLTIKAMVELSEEGLARMAFDLFGAIPIWDVLAPALDSGSVGAKLQPWIKLAVSDASTVAQVLTSGRIKTQRALGVIAHMIGPDDIPNEFGEDPWVTAVRGATGVIDDGTYFMSYLLSRAFGYRSRNNADLAVIAFEVVYSAVGMSNLHDDAWVLLEPRLPHVPYWSQWDRCEQLRRGVAKLFLDQDLDADAFCRLSTRDDVFEELVRTISKNWRSYRYLQRVQQALVANADHNAHRIAMLDRYR
jgi:hypothetical protein